MLFQGFRSVLMGKASDAVQLLSSAITSQRSIGLTLYLPFCLPYLARCGAQNGCPWASWLTIAGFGPSAMTGISRGGGWFAFWSGRLRPRLGRGCG
jgi:hypothetical protein